MPPDVLVNAPGPLRITDDMRAAARQAPGSWLYAVDQASEPTADVPHHALIGAWRIGEDGEIAAEFRANPDYRPSPAARGWPQPADDLDRTAQLAAAGYATLDDVAVALLYHEVVFLAEADGALVPGEDGCVAVHSSQPAGSRPLPEGAAWRRSTGRELASRLPEGAGVLVNPGRWQALLPGAELAARVRGEASGGQLAGRIERFLAGELDGPALHEAFCAAQVFCQAGERPGFLAVDGEHGDRVVPVFTSLVALARATGQTAWFSTVGQDVLDLLPDGYDVVVDPGSPHTVRLRGDATQLRPRTASDPHAG